MLSASCAPHSALRARNHPFSGKSVQSNIYININCYRGEEQQQQIINTTNQTPNMTRGVVLTLLLVVVLWVPGFLCEFPCQYMQEENQQAVVWPSPPPGVFIPGPNPGYMFGVWGRGRATRALASLVDGTRLDTWIDRMYCPNQNCDPAPGAYKVFAYYANTASGTPGYPDMSSVFWFDAVPEGQTHNWVCSYGRMLCQKVFWGKNACSAYQVDNSAKDKTAEMNLSCKNQGSSCYFSADRQYWGDPFPGAFKWLYMFNCYCSTSDVWIPPATSRRDTSWEPLWGGNRTFKP